VQTTTLADILPVETASVEETIALGERVAVHLQPGDIVALYGDLGAGKTHLVKGIARALGVPPEDVSSPTFTIVHEYTGECPIYHIDAYRVDDPDEFYELGYEDYFYDEGLCLIEWPGRIEMLLPGDTIRLRLTHQGGDRRRIEWMNRAGTRGAEKSKNRGQ
jgi:tRNA threonylcarbamoyladenosine biosynthesis protein TsaE